ncbi:MAG: AAA family ATPase [Bdellovibrionota bacterium]
MSKVISFSSGKGGVGKTTLVANLGHLWAKRGSKTLLVDADWTLGKLGIALGARPKWTVESALTGRVTLAQAVFPVAENLDLLASPSGLIGFEELNAGQRTQLFYELESVSSQYDVVLMDHSSGVDWGVIQFAAAAHQHVIVTTTEPTSYMDAYAIMKILSKRFKVNEFWLVVTMSPNGSGTAQRIHRFTEFVRNQLLVRVHLLETFQLEPKLSESIRIQKPFVEQFPDAVLTSRLEALSLKLEAARGQVSSGLRYFYSQNSSLLAR